MPEELKGDAGVVAEREVVEEVDDVVGVVLVLLPQVLQDADLLLGLVRGIEVNTINHFPFTA